MNVHDHPGIQRLLDELGLSLSPAQFVPRHNVAPGALLNTVFQSGVPQLAEMEWGIVPPWARPGKHTAPLINARAETIRDKPSFRKQIATTRTVIPVNGFYEWKRSTDNRIPYYFTPVDAGAMALAGIYQISKDGVMQCCVVTIGANAMMAPIHDRMPVVLPQGTMQDWLSSEERGVIDGLMAPAADGMLRCQRVSKFVNNARNEGPECIEPVPG